MRKFNERCTFDYIFIKNLDKGPFRLICNQTVNVTKECNVKRHYKTKHSGCVYGKLDGCNRALKVKQLKEQ